MMRIVPSARASQFLAFAFLAAAAPLGAQNGVRDEIMGHFEQSASKFLMLAEAMPASTYEWAPGEGVLPVAQVYMHITRYNFMYLEDNLGIAAPADVHLDTLEQERDKARVVETMRRSIEHVRSSIAALDGEALTDTTTLYGRNVEKWAVLLQLVAHMNEHLGQSIAYARMNGVVPPWSS